MGSHSVDHYWKIYLTLVGLFLISFAGPLISDAVFSHDSWIRFGIVMTTAFVVAVIKAWLVAKHFMHVTVEARFIHYGLITALVFMAMFVAGVSPDVLNHHGHNWENVAAKKEIARALAAGPSGHHGDEHAGDHGGDHAPAEGGDHAPAEGGDHGGGH